MSAPETTVEKATLSPTKQPLDAKPVENPESSEIISHCTGSPTSPQSVSEKKTTPQKDSESPDNATKTTSLESSPGKEPVKELSKTDELEENFKLQLDSALVSVELFEEKISSLMKEFENMQSVVFQLKHKAFHNDKDGAKPVEQSDEESASSPETLSSAISASSDTSLPAITEWIPKSGSRELWRTYYGVFFCEECNYKCSATAPIHSYLQLIGPVLCRKCRLPCIPLTLSIESRTEKRKRMLTKEIVSVERKLKSAQAELEAQEKSIEDATEQ